MNNHREVVAALSHLISANFTLQEWNIAREHIEELERLAIQYGDYLHLAWALLFKGHLTWNNRIPAVENKFEAALEHCKRALVCGLWFNCLVLDEMLSGGSQATALRPIIPYCLACSEEGRQMLIALRDWWKTGVNDIGTPRPDTISPIPEGIPLLEAERTAREREPGDGSPQKSVVEQIERAL